MTSQYGAYALHAGLARPYALIRMHTPTWPGTNMHARTHRSISNTYCFSTATIIRERASMLGYKYIACLLFWAFSTAENFKTWLVLESQCCERRVREQSTTREKCCVPRLLSAVLEDRHVTSHTFSLFQYHFKMNFSCSCFEQICCRLYYRATCGWSRVPSTRIFNKHLSRVNIYHVVGTVHL
jgi:hypothetical protein